MNGSGVFGAAGGLGIGSGRFAEVLPGHRVYVWEPAALGVLLTGLCTGIGSLLVFLASMIFKRIHHSHLTVFMVSLVFTAVLQVISSSVVVMEFLGVYCDLDHCNVLFEMWLASRRSGVLLHLLVALEFFCGKFSLGSKLLQVYLTLPVVLLVNLICLLFCSVLEASVFLGAIASNLMCLLLVVAFMFHRDDKKLSLMVVLSALVCFWGTYFPSFIMEGMVVSGNHVISVTLYRIFLCLTNMRLLMDGFLCWLICRRPHPPAAPHQHLVGGHVNLDPLSQVKD